MQKLEQKIKYSICKTRLWFNKNNEENIKYLLFKAIEGHKMPYMVCVMVYSFYKAIFKGSEYDISYAVLYSNNKLFSIYI